MGYKPVYADASEVYNIQTLPPREIKQAGKIYTYGNLLFIGEPKAGIHVFNNADPSNPLAISFISIPGNRDLAIKNGTLLADNLDALVSLDISRLDSVTIASQLFNIFPKAAEAYPDLARDQYFECPDPSKGVVIGWELALLTEPKCYR